MGTPQGTRTVKTKNYNFKFLTFTPDGDNKPCKIVNVKKDNTIVPKIEDCRSFIILYDPGNKEAKDLIVKLSNVNDKKIMINFMNENKEQPQQKRNNKKNKFNPNNSLFHGKFVRARITVIKGSTGLITQALKNAKVFVGAEREMETNGFCMTLRSHSWVSFPKDLNIINNERDVQYITVMDKNHFVVYFDHIDTKDKILELIKIKKAANSLHPTYFADDHTPWSQISMNGHDSIINAKYERHNFIHANTSYIHGFDSICKASFIEKIINTALDRTDISVVESQLDIKTNSIKCNFHTTPHQSTQSSNLFTLEIISSREIRNAITEATAKIAELSNHKLEVLHELNHELVLHTPVVVLNSILQDDDLDVEDLASEDDDNSYTEVINKNKKKNKNKVTKKKKKKKKKVKKKKHKKKMSNKKNTTEKNKEP